MQLHLFISILSCQLNITSAYLFFSKEYLYENVDRSFNKLKNAQRPSSFLGFELTFIAKYWKY